ncbi:MAG: lipid-A-disaccharide synthase [Bacteroidia bacterium]|nr:lipid-A-disaccharide synthase [Bacteroidia bacterium]
MKYYVIAGEASGDLHASNLVREILRKDPGASFRAWGGDLLADSGAQVVKHIRELAFMGFTEVLLNLRTILSNIEFCKKDILSWKPDAVILVDYPGFNLRVAKFLKSKGIPVYYYISPQVWAWKASRVHAIKETVDKMIVILPFEKEWYARFGMDVNYVGHPLLDAIRGTLPDSLSLTPDSRPLVALLPGSRKQEISTMLPIMMEAAKRAPEYRYVIAGAPAMPPAFYDEITGGKVPVIHGKTYELLRHADAALVTSGTATLETALFGVPEVVCYKGNPVSYFIARQIVKVKFISLVNLVMDEEVVKELIQSDLHPENLLRELRNIFNPEYRNRLIGKYAELTAKLGGPGASERAAAIITAK